MKNSQEVMKFMQLFKQSLNVDLLNDPAASDLLTLRTRLIFEEMGELSDSLQALHIWKKIHKGPLAEANRRAALHDVIDGLVDVLYVCYGFFHAFGLNPDAAFDIVHISNLSKLNEHLKPVYRPDGKVLKSQYFKPPDFKDLINAAYGPPSIRPRQRSGQTSDATQSESASLARTLC